MSNAALTKLTIAHLRGAVEPFELSFDKDKKLTIIYDENGTGKSTICDALDFLGKGRVGSLENRGLGPTNKYWNTVNKQPADVTVTLETTTESCCARMSKAGVQVDLVEVRPRVEVLRRGQILAMVEATPGDRYKAISPFIDVSGVETAEQTLRRSIEEQTKVLDQAAIRISENRDAIEQFWQTVGKPGGDALSWATTETQRELNLANTELVALQHLQAAYQRLVDAMSRLPNTQRALQQAEQEVYALQRQLTEALQHISHDAQEMVSVLEAARGYLSKHPDPIRCPLCESSTAVAGLAGRLDQRLGAFRVVQGTKETKRAAEQKRQSASTQLDTLRVETELLVRGFEQACQHAGLPADLALPTSAAPTSIDELGDWLVQTAVFPTNWDQAIAKRQDQQKFLAALKGALKTYTDNLQSQQELAVLLPRLRRTLEIVTEERKRFSDEILYRIAQEVGRLYDAVHPGEGLNAISLGLDAKKRASLDIKTTFAGQNNLPPQAYYSESHLDTLGICIFMAIAKLDDAKNTILVLDDVLASVDEPHIERLIDMLYDEAVGFRHCLITTHYRPWKEKYRWGRLNNNKCHFVELSKWSDSDGMKRVQSVPEIERLRRLLNESPPDPQLICAKAGVILEAALDFLTQLYECSVSRKRDSRYTLGELLPAVNGKLLSALRVDLQIGVDTSGKPEYRNIALEPILKDLHKIAQARNTMGCHFNEIAHELPDSDALTFGQKVLELIEALVDPNAGWPQRMRAGSYWSNAGETRRLYPLRKP